MAFEGLGVSSDIFSQGLQGGIFFLKIGAFGLAALVLVFIIYKLFFEYYISITLLKPIGTKAFAWSNDKAKIITDKNDGTRQLILMRERDGKERITSPVPGPAFKGKKGKADHYMLALDPNFQLQPITVNQVAEAMAGNPYCKLHPEDRKWWARKEDKRRNEKYAKSDMLSKYLPSMIVIFAFVITFFIAYFGFSHLGEGMSRLAGEFGNVAAQCAAF